MFLIDVRIRCPQSSLTKGEVWKLAEYTCKMSMEEGLEIPFSVLILVLSREQYENLREQVHVGDESCSCKLYPPTLFIRGDLTSDNMAFKILKYVRLLIHYNTYHELNENAAEEWARGHFMNALSYMVE